MEIGCWSVGAEIDKSIVWRFWLNVRNERSVFHVIEFSMTATVRSYVSAQAPALRSISSSTSSLRGSVPNSRGAQLHDFQGSHTNFIFSWADQVRAASSFHVGAVFSKCNNTAVETNPWLTTTISTMMRWILPFKPEMFFFSVVHRCASAFANFLNYHF